MGSTDERTAWVVEEIRPPSAVSAPGWDDFLAVTDVRNRAETHALGHDALGYRPEELLPAYLDPANVRKRLLVARVDGRIVGRAVLSTWLRDPDTADVNVAVAPEQQGRGIGRDLGERLVRIASADGRGTLTAYTMHRPEPRGAVLPSPAGVGEVGTDDPAARLLLTSGFRLAQTSRMSALDVPGMVRAGVDGRLGAEAARTAGDDYRAVSWTGPTPEDRLDDIALLRTRMSTDIPVGDLPESEDVWDAARVREDDAVRDGSGRVAVTTAAEHRASGRLVAFTELAVATGGIRADGHAYAYQKDTLVMREHRGRRLGMLVKTANLAELCREAPEVDRVITFNADENRPMLAINEALGFLPMGTGASWMRVLAAASGTDDAPDGAVGA